MSDDQCARVPLVEQLRSVPLDAKLRIDTPNALGCMDTRSIPVGRLCHEAADALGVTASFWCDKVPHGEQRCTKQCALCAEADGVMGTLNDQGEQR